ncbi:DUF3169 family protein [Macrococcus caseolyticus]|uniref:DUF3169 family protein n=1 Tax=Macrococcoides caseolyticum TaxID=69966 RepID=UPI0024BC3712|nr:DUF3169 family protein [Macrococcus caseolyticus]MDJ1155267.1 DUF3169 family protein [Macrococcus caseolyticus]MEB8172110.1 DUF3169 family protein [Macrococcus caseolyticus]
MSKKKKSGFLKIMIGMAFGAIAGYSIPALYDEVTSLQSTYNIRILWYIVPILFVIALYLYFKSIHQFKAMNSDINLSEDDRFIYQVTHHNKASANVVNAYHILLLSLCLSITILIEPETSHIIIFAVYFIACAIFYTFISKQTAKVLAAYPMITNSDVSIEFGDPNLMEKVIDGIDEGERLVMLRSLSKTYEIMIIMLSVILILLGIYQAATGENQYLAMFAIAAVLIYSTVVYYKKNEEFNR